MIMTFIDFAPQQLQPLSTLKLERYCTRDIIQPMSDIRHPAHDSNAHVYHAVSALPEVPITIRSILQHLTLPWFQLDHHNSAKTTKSACQCKETLPISRRALTAHGKLSKNPRETLSVIARSLPVGVKAA